MLAAILKGLIVLIGYVLTIGVSGIVVRHFVGRPSTARDHSKVANSDAEKQYDIGAVIGKCENFLTITMILANAFTGLAVIFAAKSIVRSEDIKKDPRYFLGGTLVNFSFSVLMGFLIKLVLAGMEEFNL